MAAARRHKTPRIEASARAGQSFEPKPAALMGQHSLHIVGRARGALAIDVPRTCPRVSPISIDPGSLVRAETVERRALATPAAPVAPVGKDA